jgi:hypothetical protein
MIRSFVDRDSSDMTMPLLGDGEDIRYRLNNVELAFRVDTTEGVGNIFITSSRVIWIAMEKAFDFDSRSIILHAISHDKSSYPKSCLYCQFDRDCDNEEEDVEDNEAQFPPQEMFLALEESTDVQGMFDAFSAMAMDNPDDLEEYDGNLIYNEDEVRLSQDQAEALADLESKFIEPDLAEGK